MSISDIRQMTRMRCTVACTLMAALVPLSAAHAAPQRLGPLETMVDDRFDGSQTTFDWIPVLGDWNQTSGTYSSQTALPTALSHLPREIDDVQVDTGVNFHAYRARLLNQSASVTTSVGVVYQYLDPANYHELIFSPDGQARLRRVENNVPTVLATTTYEEGGQNSWIDIEIYNSSNVFNQPHRMSYFVNGQLLFENVHQEVLAHSVWWRMALPHASTMLR